MLHTNRARALLVGRIRTGLARTGLARIGLAGAILTLGGLTLPGPTLLGLTLGTAVAAPAPAAPDVIVPLALPSLHALRSAAPVAIVDSVAPMPDQDANAPILTSEAETKVVPTLYVDKSHYQGDGYAAGSSDRQRTLQPAAGLALDVPLN